MQVRVWSATEAGLKLATDASRLQVRAAFSALSLTCCRRVLHEDSVRATKFSAHAVAIGHRQQDGMLISFCRNMVRVVWASDQLWPAPRRAACQSMWGSPALINDIRRTGHNTDRLRREDGSTSHATPPPSRARRPVHCLSEDVEIHRHGNNRMIRGGSKSESDVDAVPRGLELLYNRGSTPPVNIYQIAGGQCAQNRRRYQWHVVIPTLHYDDSTLRVANCGKPSDTWR
ncbi:hypothetical protein B0T25DRAFT_310081 [Lasiosphaeria hispida]|uniref:Uncharacterized protein n=1 Tax=Lasiosphaeria hispida TaxID=260671 RepID=A0AAJ0H998_9PEZI|nr:hypothetical protein B0T25DRAFT_310081 [Lasiosphaeria hispida]